MQKRNDANNFSDTDVENLSQKQIQSRKNSIIENKLSRLILLLVICCLCVCLGWSFCFVSHPSNEDYLHQLDEYFTVVYNTQIKEKGESDIEKIVQNVSNISDSHEKLEAIALWQVSNWQDTFWEQRFRNDTSYRWSLLGVRDPTSNQAYGYEYNEFGGIRAIDSAKYTNNETWIAGNRIGNCEDLATLFSYVANQSGFETRIVTADFVGRNGDGHVWNEVKINGKWQYYDIDRAGQYYHYDKNVKSWGDWRGNPESYTISYKPVIEQISDTDGEDTQQRYTSLTYQ